MAPHKPHGRLKAGNPRSQTALTMAFRQYGGLSKGLSNYCKLHCRLALRSVALRFASIPSIRIGIGSFAFGQVQRLDGLADVEPIF
jgi:hypothetical protein